jgi:superfamily II DNA or RNA helicase
MHFSLRSPHLQLGTAASPRSQSVLVYLPTGGGKTVVASHLIHFFHTRNKRSMFVVNRTTLIQQTARALIDQTGFFESDDIGYIKAGRARHSERPIQIVSIQTFASSRATKATDTEPNATKKDKQNKADLLPHADVLILDEAHGAIAQQYDSLRDAYPAALVIGLTATPFRLKHDEHLSTVFQTPITGPSVSLLIQQGHLCPPVIFPRSGKCADPMTSKEVQTSQAIKLIVKSYLARCRLRGAPTTTTTSSARFRKPRQRRSRQSKGRISRTGNQVRVAVCNVLSIMIGIL